MVAGSMKPVKGHTNNMSRGGLCANVEASIPSGSDVDIDIVLVFDAETQSEALRLPARIAWCTILDEGYQIGVSFRGLDAERLEYLGLFLKYLDDGSKKDRPFAKAANIDDRFG